MDPCIGEGCQLSRIATLAEGRALMPPATMAKRIKLMIRRRLSPGAERRLKLATNNLVNWWARVRRVAERPAVVGSGSPANQLVAGDLVRVRSQQEIESTLNHWHQLRGCTFMPEMACFCGTQQRVLKPLARFVNERDLRVKTARGVVLLDGVMCQGTADFGRCDRSCLLFWRAEWLEKLAEESIGPRRARDLETAGCDGV